MSLRLMDKIEFHTETGPKAIELWFGDITLLPATDKVDLLLLSAFRGKILTVNWLCTYNSLTI